MYKRQVMFRLDKGILSPTKSVSKSFEEVKDTAFEGSDYGDEEGGLLETIIGFVDVYKRQPQ